MENLEYVLCAAIWYNDNIERVHLPKNVTTGIVICGYRHPNCFVSLSVLYKEENNMFELSEDVMRTNILRNSKQGFLTSKNRFVDRKEAAEIALSSGQIKALKYGNILYSEDLY